MTKVPQAAAEQGQIENQWKAEDQRDTIFLQYTENTKREDMHVQKCCGKDPGELQLETKKYSNGHCCQMGNFNSSRKKFGIQ